MPSFEKLTAEFKHYLERQAVTCAGASALVEGAILIARQEYPKLLAPPFQQELDQMAMEVSGRISNASSQTQKVGVLNHYFFEDLGFKGNRERYYETANSYWPDVMERRTGIPISLAAIYLEVGWRLGFPLSGINFPGHFLVGWTEPALSFYIDVFANGKILSTEDLNDLVRRFVGEQQSLKPDSHLRRAEVGDILYRMLSNLKGIHAQAGHLERALLCVDWMRMIKPQDWNSLRDKGMFLASLDRLPEAEEALLGYLEASKKAPDYSQVWQVLYSIRAQDPIHRN